MDSILKFFINFRLSKHLFLLIILAFIFSVCARLYWIFWASEYPLFFWNDVLMISTNDGYAFAEGARDMLAGFHQPNDLSYFGSSLSTLTFWIVKFLGIKLEIAMLYMSVFFSSLIVVPIILIANLYGNAKAGFLAALIASVANSYYNRTMAGYYDTDMLTIVIPMFVIWGLIRVIEYKSKTDIIISPIFILIYHWWYASGFSLVATTIGLFLLHTLVFERKNLLLYTQLILLILAITNLNLYVKFAIVLFVYFVFLFTKNDDKRIIFGVLAASFVLFVALGGLNPVIFQLKFYIFRDVSELSNVNFKFFNVNQTIQESGIVDLVLFCERISGHVITFFISLVGLCMLCFKHRSFCVGLGMALLGFLALKGGLRFTIYAVPVMAIGFGYFVVFILSLLDIKDKLAFNIGCILIAFFALLPIREHIKSYEISPVFVRSEVEVLDKFKAIADREDYVLAWWDYGYPIRYYSDVKTLIDGGKHLGRDNFAVSFALSQNQTSSANMARFEVEYTERNFKEKFGVNLAKMIQEQNASNVSEFLLSLGDKDVNLPTKTREIYYYLPDRMMYIFPTILRFSRLDLDSGKNWAAPLFFTTERYEKGDGVIELGNGLSLSNNLSNIILNGSILSINTFFETKYDENGSLNVTRLENDTNSGLYVIFMRDYGRFLVLDKAMFESAFIQLFVLENYDDELFEPVILDGAAKIYKLKR